MRPIFSEQDYNIMKTVQQTAINSTKLILVTLIILIVLSIIFIFIFKWAIKDYKKNEKIVAGQSNKLHTPHNSNETDNPVHSDVKPAVKKQNKFISGDKLDANEPVSQEIAALAMFDKHDFAPRTDQFPLSKKNQTVDTTRMRPRDFFANPA